MSNYLHIHCGPHQLLLDAGIVVEVAARDAADVRECGERRQWRDRQLPILDLAAWLGVAGHSRQQIVISEQGREGVGDRVVDVDRIERLLSIDSREFAEISSISEKLDALVDGVWRDGDTCLLRIRQPFAWQAETTTPARGMS